MKAGQVPWVGTTVTIVKTGHPLKGYKGVVKDTFCNQMTQSGLKVLIQMLHLSPTVPYHKLTLDYDDVVEAS